MVALQQRWHMRLCQCTIKVERLNRLQYLVENNTVIGQSVGLVIVRQRGAIQYPRPKKGEFAETYSDSPRYHLDIQTDTSNCKSGR